MAKQTVNLGTSLNSGDGDPLRTAFDKINDNFDELYARDIGTDPSNLGVNLAPSVSGANDLGTTPQRWGTVFVKDFIDIGNGSTITVNADGEFVFNKPIISTVAVKNDIVGSIFADDSSIAFNAQTNTFFGKLDGDVTGSVYADNSTILVDGVNGTISAANLTGALPALDGSALTGVNASSIAFSNITSKPTTLAGYGITDAITAGGNVEGNLKGSVFADDSTLLVDGVAGTINGSALTSPLTANLTINSPVVTGIPDFTGCTIVDMKNTAVDFTGSTITGTNFLTTVAFADLTSKPTTLAGYGITDAANTSAETTFTADVKFDTGVEEKFATLTGSTGVVAHDCDNGHVFYHTGAAGDITANFTNLGLTAEYATNLTVIINQGATPYEVTAVQIGGAAQTINWQGGSAPTGNANGIDSFSFTILNDGGSFVVLGQMVDFT
tara:strand:+ start:561 stop:1883 length:1323 start_codon:yes stop_codon:yes gene_type:complete